MSSSRVIRILFAAIVSATLGGGHAAAQGGDPPADEPGVARLGPVTARVSVEPRKSLFGDPVLFVLEVTAEPDVEVIMPEFQDGLERFQIVSWTPEERVEADGRTVHRQEYTLDPPFSGEQSIPPILVEFIDRRPGQKPAPDDADAYELLTPRIDFDVESVLPEDVEVDLAPRLGTLQPLAPPEPARWPWFVGGGVMLLLASPFLIRGFLRWRRRARRRSAYEIARSRLEKLLARPRPTSETIEPFFVELSSIVRQYLEDRFELRAPELTTEEFLEVVADSPDVTAEHQQLLRRFLRQADLVKFAHSVPGNDAVEDCIGAARRFLDETRENAPLLAEEDVDEPRPRSDHKPGELSRV